MASPSAPQLFLQLFSSVSWPTQLALLAFVLAILRAAQLIIWTVVVRPIKRLLPSPSSQPKKGSGSSDVEYSAGTPAKSQPEQKQGVGMKKLLEEQKRAKAKQSAGQDRHTGSKLFLNTLKGHTDAVNGLSFNADGLALVTACDDRTVRVFSLGDGVAGKVGFKARTLRKAPADVAFGADPNHVAVLTQGVVNAAGLCMLDMRGKEGEVEWEVEDIHPQRQAGLCLRSAPSSQGGYGILLAASPKTDLRVFTSRGQQLGHFDSGGMQNYTAALSRDGRFAAAATFTSDVKVYEIGHDRLGSFTGIRKAMDLKGHRSRVLCLDFSPDLTKMVTGSADGTMKVWNINVRFHMDEDPKVLLSTGLALTPGKCYQHLAWGPDGFIAGIYEGSIHFIDSRSGEVVEKIEGAHDSQITCVEWAPMKLSGPDGKVAVLATGSTDNKVRLWRGPVRLV